MGIWDFLFSLSNDDDDEEEEVRIDPQEVDETLEIIDDPEFDEWATAGYIRDSNSGQEDNMSGDNDDEKGTGPIKMPWWWPFS